MKTEIVEYWMQEKHKKTGEWEKAGCASRHLDVINQTVKLWRGYFPDITFRIIKITTTIQEEVVE